MFKREKKLIALLLSAAMVFTTNTSLFAATSVGEAEEVVAVQKDSTAKAENAGWMFANVADDEYSNKVDITTYTDGRIEAHLDTTTKVNATLTGSTELKDIKVTVDSEHGLYTELTTETDSIKLSVSAGKTEKKSVKVSFNAAQFGGDNAKAFEAFQKIVTVSPKYDTVEAKAISGNGVFAYVFTKTGHTETPAEKAARLEAEAISKNEATHPVSVNLTNGVTVSYNQYIPYFGKNLKDFKSLGIKVIYQGKEYLATKGKVIRKKGANESVSNASIVIKKVDGLDKKVLKDVKKATKANKKNLGTLQLRIYAYRLDDNTAANLSGLTAKGKSGKYQLKFKLNSKSQKIAQKKDSFGNKNQGTWTVSAGGISVSTNDIQGKASAAKFTNKTK
jgi:hypothetical protein